MKKTILGLFLILAVIGIYYQQSNVAKSAPTTGAQVGEKLKEGNFKAMSGENIKLPPADGKVYVLNLWATWCPPCREEMPEVQAFYDKYKNDSKVGLYLINVQESPKDIELFFQKNNYSMPVVIDTDGVSGGMLATRAIPTTVVLNRDGVVVFRKVGTVTLSELEAAVNKVR